MGELFRKICDSAAYHPWASWGVATLACLSCLGSCIHLGIIYLWPLILKWWALPVLGGIGGPALAITVATLAGIAVFFGLIGVADGTWFLTGAFCYLGEKLGILEDRKLRIPKKLTLSYPAQQKRALELIKDAFGQLKERTRRIDLGTNAGSYYTQLKKWYIQFQKVPLSDVEVAEIIEDISIYLFSTNFYLWGYESNEVSGPFRWLLKNLEELYPPKKNEDERRLYLRKFLNDKQYLIKEIDELVIAYDSSTPSNSTIRVMRLINSNKLWGNEVPRGIKAMRKDEKINIHSKDEALKVMKQIAELQLAISYRYLRNSNSHLFYTKVMRSNNIEDLANQLIDPHRY